MLLGAELSVAAEGKSAPCEVAWVPNEDPKFGLWAVIFAAAAVTTGTGVEHRGAKTWACKLHCHSCCPWQVRAVTFPLTAAMMTVD